MSDVVIHEQLIHKMRPYYSVQKAWVPSSNFKIVATYFRRGYDEHLDDDDDDEMYRQVVGM